MDFLTLAKERYSVRKLSDQPIEKEKIEKILKAAQLAPTAMNFQPHRILVIDAPEELEKMRNSTRYHYNAPVVMIVCYDTNVSWKRDFDGKDEGIVDASVVATHILLEVANLGLRLHLGWTLRSRTHKQNLQPARHNRTCSPPTHRLPRTRSQTSSPPRQKNGAKRICILQSIPSKL
jgi:nitroreductase